MPVRIQDEDDASAILSDPEATEGGLWVHQTVLEDDTREGIWYLADDAEEVLGCYSRIF